MEGAIEQIAAAIAHEVKNPITLVKANIDLLEANDISRAHEKNFALMRAELDRINDLMMDFISLTKPAEKEKDMVYPYDLLCAIKGKYETAHREKLCIGLQWENRDLTVLGNEKSLVSLFDNILKNALEAMDLHGEIQISGEEKEGNVLIAITDQGPGLDDANKEQLYDQFYTTKPSGNGLGLSICRKIAAEHGGSFTLDNRDDGVPGCTATVILPLYGD